MKNTLLIVSCYLISIGFVTAQKVSTKGNAPLFKKTAVLQSSGSVKLHRRVSVTTNLEIPATGTPNSVIYHTGFALLYNEKHEQASWVAYQLKKDETVSTVTRSDQFFVDPLVKTGSANDFDYEASGYDRGHLAPAGDMVWSSSAMSESFYYSNVSPQVPAFNRGVWKRLEELVRFWATAYGSIYIVTGPVLSNNLPSIGPNHVSVPRYYYKAILRYGANPAAIGFILPNQASAATLKSFAVNVDSLEVLTGIDFFPALPDVVEKRLESKTSMDSWKWTRNLSTTANEATNQTIKNKVKSTPFSTRIHNATKVAIQCSGTTRAGRRCLRTTTNANGRCWQH